MTEQDTLWGQATTLQEIDHQIKNGIDALLVVAQQLDNRQGGEPEGPACYFIAEGLSQQRYKLMECIDTAMEARKVERPKNGPTLVS